LPRFPIDADGVVRKYAGVFKLKNNARSTKSFARAVVEKYCPCLTANADEKIFNLASVPRRFEQISAQQLLDPKTDDDKKHQEEWATKVHDKIVLIGGEFDDARDKYPTPLQDRFGLELNAMAIDSDLQGGGIREVPQWVLFLADVGVGAIFVSIFWCFERRPYTALLWAVPGTMVATILLSYAFFHVFAYWLSFIPVFVGVNVHQFYEHVKQAREAQARLKKADARRKQG
jgi:CHASE2 domain-containing sensor protein